MIFLDLGSNIEGEADIVHNLTSEVGLVKTKLTSIKLKTSYKSKYEKTIQAGEQHPLFFCNLKSKFHSRFRKDWKYLKI